MRIGSLASLVVVLSYVWRTLFINAWTGLQVQTTFLLPHRRTGIPRPTCPDRYCLCQYPPYHFQLGAAGAGGGGGGGFGASGNDRNKNKKKNSAAIASDTATASAAASTSSHHSAQPQQESPPMVKLKPKQQWDRYNELKIIEKVTVGIRLKGEWLEVGHVKSQKDVSTEIAVARQRALIAEHAKRIYPIKFSSKESIEWGFKEGDTNDWVHVDKSVLDQLNLKGIEKRMGFEGTPDPNTGFYCFYNEGRLVNSNNDVSSLSKPAPKRTKL